jgi:acetyl-CoA carboxylase carboxyltransferase component
MINAVTNSSVSAPHDPHGRLVRLRATTGCAAAPFGPRFVFAWPNAKTAVMGPQQLAGVLSIVARQSAASMGRPFDERPTRRCASRWRSRSNANHSHCS